jgi:uncharacterized beta-barrel protein YwiB (DUF1934 family)
MIVMVKITASIRNEDGEVDKIEFTTEGKLEKFDGVTKIMYRESEFTGMSGSLTTLEISKDRMSMKREGDGSSEMIFEKGVRHESQYSTPYGVFKMEMLTKKFVFELDEQNKGNVMVNYDLSISGMTESNNQLSIEVL